MRDLSTRLIINVPMTAFDQNLRSSQSVKWHILGNDSVSFCAGSFITRDGGGRGLIVAAIEAP